MTQLRALSAIALLFTFALAGSACRNPVKEISGTYIGDLSIIENGTARNARVRTTITDANKDGDELNFELKDETTNQALASIQLKRKSKTKIVLRTQYLPGSNEVELRDRGACAARADSDERESLITFCATESVISLFAADPQGTHRLFIYLSKNESHAADPIVANGVWRLEDLYRRVRSQTYETRLGVERLYQANEDIKAARGRLVPGLSVGTVLSAIDIFSGAGVMSIVTTLVGSLMPFIFPSQWYELDRSKALYESEVYSYRALVANQMNLVESLYYGILRDQYYLERQEEFTGFLRRYHEEMKLREEMGLVRPGTSLAFRNFLLANESDKQQLRTMLRIQYAILSRGIGLSPRNGIRALAQGAAPRVENAEPLHENEVAARILAASIELKQLYYMQRAAVLQKKAVTWSFINPSQWVGFNASIVHEVRVAKSQVREVELLRMATEDQIEEQIVSVVEEHNALIERNRLVTESIDNAKYMLERIDAEMAAGVSIDVSELRSNVESLFGLQALKSGIDSSYAVNVGKLNRMLMNGPYQDVITLEVAR
ncbi:MAG: hypothetical protein IT285_01315 [Bdellovibrionales bacterium]|nr:hypothetical protein [Bdellovibrionales bacterium]